MFPAKAFEFHARPEEKAVDEATALAAGALWAHAGAHDDDWQRVLIQDGEIALGLTGALDGIA